MVKRYMIETPGQLRELYALHPAGNPRMDCLARVWRAQDALRSANHANPPIPSMAYVEFDTRLRRAIVCKTINGRDECVGTMPYNKAIRYCKENLRLVKAELGG